MSLVVNTNIGALNAYRSLSTNQMNLSSAMEKLSSGLRINKAADDASGLAISQGLTSQINGLTQAVSNANDGINVAQIADGAMATQQTILQRMNTLAIQAANGTQDTASLSAIASEVTALTSQLDSISASTSFGGKKLLDGSASGGIVFQVGSTSATTDQVSLTIGSTSSSSLGLTSATLDFSSASGARAALTSISSALATLSSDRATVGATQNQLNYTVTNLQSTIQNVTASRSNITDADLATEVTQMTQSQILVSAATSMLSQANSAPQAILKLLQ